MEVEEEDRISSLPQCIIHDHIFRFLPNKDIKVTGSLSKSWYHFCHSFPELDFNDCVFRLGLGVKKDDMFGWGEGEEEEEEEEEDKCLNYVFGLGYGFGEEGEEEEKKNWLRFRVLEKEKDKYLANRLRLPGEEFKYLNYIEQTLQRFYDLNSFKTIIRRLSIPLIFRPLLAPLLDRWIELVLQYGGVEDFNIEFRNPEKVQPHYYDLPQALFDANSMVKRAVFTRCSLLRTFLSPIPYANSLMRKLSLEKVLLDEISFNCIISSCPLIEELSLSNCIGRLNCLGISNLHKLKSLSICDGRNQINVIEIDAPSLQSLDIQGSCVKILGSYPILTDLYLSRLRALDSQDIPSRLPFLRRLCLVNIVSLAKLRVSSDSLNKLTILRCHNLVELYIDAPNLLSVVYKGSSIPLLEYSLTHTAQWYVTTGYHRMMNESISNLMVKLINFVSKIKLVDLHLEDIHDIDFSELKRRIFRLPVARIDNLKLCFWGFGGYSYNICILDCVLWSYRPRTLSMESKLSNCHYVFHICQIIKLHRGDCCSCTFDRSNWLHRIKDVMHVKKDGTESRLLVDGTFTSYSMNPHNCGEIKVIFKW